MMRRHIPLLFLLVFIPLIVLAGQPGASAQDAHPIVARVTVTTPAEFERLTALGVDLLEMRRGNHLFILTTAEEVERLRQDGWKITVDKRQTALLNAQQTATAQGLRTAETFMGGYRTVPEMRAFVDAQAAQYPQLTEVFSYGSSWERVQSGGTAGHDLFGIRLTNKAVPGPKPTLFLMTAIHARELSTSELALRFIDYLLSNYGTDGDVTWLLDEHLIVVVPVVNPDGRAIAEQGYLQRKNTNTSYGGSCVVPQIGVDLNRTYNFKWGTVNKPTQSFCSETYPGPVPASEPETTAIQDLVRSLFADQRGPGDTDASPITTTGILLTIHSYSNLVLWPWGWTATPAPNAADLSAIGSKFAAYNSYTPQQSIDLYPTSGTTDDWAYGELGIAAFTFEIGPGSGACSGFFPPFSCLDGGSGGSFWPRNLPAFLYAARIARAPFQLVQGPTPETATATAVLTDRTEIRVQLDEQWNGGQAIVAAEYYLDTPPWAGGIGIPMTPADGSFNTVSEVATAIVGPFTQRRLLYVRGQDANGHWGPVRGVYTQESPRLPDLVVTALSNPPAVAAPRGKFPVTDTVQNQGPTTARASQTRYYLSLDAVKDSGDTLLARRRAVPRLASGVSSTKTGTVIIPVLTAQGTYFLLACADHLAVVTESDEANNCRASATQVTVGP